MQQVRILPRTKRGKQIVKEWGEVWEILRTDHVAFDEGQHALIAPVSLLEGESHDRAARWVKLSGDRNFDIIR